MNKLITIFSLSSSLFFLTACATKQYSQASAVTVTESAIMSCDDLKLEIVRTQSVQTEIENTGEFDVKTVLGFFGDFGIGNGIAKSTARKKVSSRLEQLDDLKNIKCQ